MIMATRKAKRPAGKTRTTATVAYKQPEAARRTAPRPGPVGVAAATRQPRVPKGRRPRFFPEAGTDQLFGIVTALTAELSVAFERIETLERTLEKHGALQRSEIESHQPDAAEAAERTAAREALIERVFQVLEDYAEPGSSRTD
jgi:hypothetical protein